MSDSLGGAGGLRERAAATRVVVIGGGVAGLVAALECAKVGLTVTVLEGGATPGGAVRRADVGGLALDVGAESYATRGGHVRALIDELGIGDRVVAPAGGRAWLAGVPGVGAAPMPAGGVLGIPDNPFAPDVRRVGGAYVRSCARRLQRRPSLVGWPAVRATRLPLLRRRPKCRWRLAR